jgi:hypothetical protein
VRNIRVGTAHALKIDPERVQRFYEANWKRKIALTDSRYYEWQFVAKPSNPGIDECVVATAQDEIVGVMGLNSRPFFLGGRQMNGAELTTWVVAEANKGLGSGPAILDHIINQYDVLIGMGITGEALAVYLRKGFRFLKAIPRFMRVFDLDAVAQYAKVDVLARKLVRQRLAAPGAPASRVCDRADFDRAFEAASATHNLFARNTEFIQWRYCAHPYFQYQLYCVDGNKAPLIVATRIDQLPNGSKLLRVIDMFGHLDDISRGLSFVDGLCYENGIALADWFCTASRINSYFLAHGWFSMLDEEFFQFPHLFSPIELRHPSTTSLILWSRNEFSDLLDYSRLYVTKQDADFDRPTVDYLQREGM